MQLIAVVPLIVLALWFTWNRPEWRLMVGGVSTMTLAWFALRTLH